MTDKPTQEEREIERIEGLYARGEIDEPSYERLMHELLTEDWQLSAEEMLP